MARRSKSCCRKKPSLAARRNNDYSKYWQHKADRLWSKTVRRNWGFKCAICGSTDNLQSHHVIFKSGQGGKFRYDLKNGISLCISHHGKWGAYDSAHSGNLAFAVLLESKFPEIWIYVKTNIAGLGRGACPRTNYREKFDEIAKVAHEEDISGL